jgi:hypothetical protein
MAMTSIIDKILQSAEFEANPPVLLDIGASGCVHARWKPIARYSIAIAFDPDERDFDVSNPDLKGFRKLYVFNKIVTDSDAEAVKFYLTKSPHCSSTLRPDAEALKPWAFSDLFEVQETRDLPAISLPKVLAKLNLNRIDWFKTDSQGTDLRLFKSLDPAVQRKVLAAEFEPGIMRAYEGEDRLCDVMDYMHSLGFWASRMEVKGSQRFSPDAANECFSNTEKRFLSKAAAGQGLHLFTRTSPGWAEMTYLNPLSDPSLTAREYKLQWIFSMLDGQVAHCLEVAKRGAEKFNDPIFAELAQHSVRLIRRRYLGLPAKAVRKAMRRILPSSLRATAQ